MLPLTYQEVGQTAGDGPAGFRAVQMSTSLGTGRPLFDSVVHRLMTWQVHEGSGLTVRASSREVSPDVVVVLTIRLGPVSLSAPCRVVYVIDEQDRRGFAYGTLPGHPESGEEVFAVQIAADGEVTGSIRAFSRPASLLARLGGPVARRVQDKATVAYLDAMMLPS
jgi:uncharacterized protein (UPF0548 family)